MDTSDDSTTSPNSPDLPEHLRAILEERGVIYGEPSHSHRNIGLGWTALIQQHYQIRLDHPLPEFLVELMMVVFKANRSALGNVHHEDNYDDLDAYARFARQDSPKWAEVVADNPTKPYEH